MRRYRMTIIDALLIEATYRGMDTSTLPEPQRRVIVQAAAMVAEGATEALARLSSQERETLDDRR